MNKTFISLQVNEILIMEGNSGERWFEHRRFHKFWRHYSQIMMTTHKKALLDARDCEKNIANTLKILVNAVYL